MTRVELVDRIVEQHRVPRKVADAVVDTIFGAIQSTLVDGGRVELRGFGSFRVKDYDGYRGRNPRTGEPIDVAPKRLPAFKPGQALREALADSVDGQPWSGEAGRRSTKS